MRRPEGETELATLDDVLVTRLDVQDRAIDAAADAGVTRFGRIDALVNNAGFGLFGVFEATPREKIQRAVRGECVWRDGRHTRDFAHFRQNKGGLITNVTSRAGVYGLPMMSLYCASKFAVEGFSEALSYELASQNIAVKLIEPGGVVSTNFSKRLGAEGSLMAQIDDYAPFTEKTEAIFAGLRSDRHATEEDVSRVFLQAATDGSNRLRYVATTDILPLVHARRETPEDSYLAFMRSHFADGGAPALNAA